MAAILQNGHRDEQILPTKSNITLIMAHFPDIEDHKPGRDVLFAFNEDIGKPGNMTLVVMGFTLQELQT